MYRVPIVEHLEIRFHWLAVTDSQNTCESVKLHMYQTVGALVTSVSVVPRPTQCTGRPQSGSNPRTSSAAMRSLPRLAENLVVATP